MNIELITAVELLTAAEKSACNGDCKLKFRQFVEGIEKLQQTKQRLVFELLAVAWQSLETKNDPRTSLMWAILWVDSIEEGRFFECIDYLEKITLRYFEILEERKVSTIHPDAMALSLALTGIRMMSRNRYNLALDVLKSKCSDVGTDIRFEMIRKIEQSISEAMKVK